MYHKECECHNGRSRPTRSKLAVATLRRCDFVGSLVRWFVCSLVRSLVRWICSLVRWFVGSFVGSFVRSFVRSLVRSLVRSFRIR